MPTAPAIPIRNLYRMLAYAWGALDEAVDPTEADEDDPSSLADLFGTVLCRHMRRIVRRGLDQDYIEHEETLRGIRGRVLLAPTVLRQLDRNGRAVCRFDERSPDTAMHRTIKSVARRLLASDTTPETRRELHDLVLGLDGVTDVEPRLDRLRGVQLHRNNRRYRVPLAICRFVLRNAFVDERTGHLTFDKFMRNEHKMRRLFEQFVRSYFRRTVKPLLPGLRVGTTTYAWSPTRTASAATPPEGRVQSDVPTLNTDVTLTRGDHLWIVECKYTASLHDRSQHGHRMLKPAYLRQLYAYCMAERDGRRTNGTPRRHRHIEGVLLHAQPKGEPYDARIELGVIPCRIMTVDLGATWPTIERQLWGVVMSTNRVADGSEEIHGASPES